MINIIYWTMTGNTESMANYIAEGVKEAGKEVSVKNVSEVTIADIENENVFALGASAMGAEQLDDEMDAFVSDVEKICNGKTIALFGSYDWGDGEWMRTWAKRLQDKGANIVNNEGLICHLTPEEDDIKKCHELGSKLANC